VSTVHLGAGDVTAVVNPAAGGRLSEVAYGRYDLLARGGPVPWEWGSFVMAPYAGRVRHGILAWNGRTYHLPITNPPHAIHGLVLDRPWDVVDVTGDAVDLRCALDERWPWKGHVTQRIALRPDGLDAQVGVHADDGEWPAWCGWHPWFRRTLKHGAPVSIDLDARGILRRDAAGIVTDDLVAVPKGPWDDCFVDVRWPITLTWKGALSLEITATTDYAVIFTERPSVVCVEPQTAPPDAVALDRFAVVRPGEPLVVTMAWTFGPG
jgi:galactose mutarotase-like enzyme